MKKILNVAPSKLSFLSYHAGIGNAPVFISPNGTKQINEKLKEIAWVFNEDGSFDPNYPKAEEYALCLAEDGNDAEALELFDLIINGASEVLAVPTNDGYSKMVVNQKSKLGMEGMFVYARLLRKVGRTKEAGKFFLEIIDADQKRCAIRGGDIKEHSAKEVLELNAFPFGKKSQYLDLYERFRRESY